MSGVPARVGPYRIVAPLGEGGMGTVVRAVHASLGVHRAVKLLNLADDPDAPRLARFEREVRALASVRHPNLVAVHDGGVAEGRPYFAMDLLEGEALDDVLRRGPLAPARALEVALGVARGVAALHAQGIVHRDLKPSNVILATDGRPVVIDLGLAVAPEQDQRLTQTGALVGTPAYMAPEQLDGRAAVSPRIDVYALGLLLFELLTGRGAVDTDTTLEALLASILNAPRPAPTSADPDLPAAVDAVCARATALDPEARYPDGAAFAEAAAAVLARPGPSRRARRRRRRAGLALTGAALAGAGLLAARGRARPLAPPPAAAPDDLAGEPPAGRPAAPATEPAGSGLSPGEVVRARRALRALRRLRPRARHEAAQAWLQAHPGHPDEREAAEVARTARLAYPAASLEEPGLERGGVLLASGLAVLIDEARRGLTVWDPEAQQVIARRALRSAVTDLARSADGRSALAISGDAIARVDERGRAGDALTPLPGRFLRLAWPASGARVAVGGGPERSLAVVELGSGDVVLALGPFAGHVNDVALSPDGRTLAAACGTADLVEGVVVDFCVRVWDVATGALRLEEQLPGKGESLAFSPDGLRLLVGDDMGRVSIVDLGFDRVVGRLHGEGGSAFDASPPAHLSCVRDLAFAADGRRLVTCSGSGRTHPGGRTGRSFALWDVDAGAVLHRVDRPTRVRSVSPSERFDRVLIVGRGFAEVWFLPE